MARLPGHHPARRRHGTPLSTPPTATTGRRLVLVRHGRTAWNADRRAQGQTDIALDELGHDQAARMAPAVAALGPALLWASDLARADETAAYLAKETGLEVISDPRLREYALGEREGMGDAEWRERFGEERASFEDGDYDVVPGGETSAVVAARTAEACRELLDATGPGQIAVAVSHGGAIRTAVGALLGWDPLAARSLGSLENCAWARLEERTRGGRLRLVAWNVQA